MAKREPVMPPIGGKVMHVGNGSAVWVFNTLADLKAKKVASVKQDDQAIIIGYDNEGDGRSMQFRYDASSSQTADDINYVDPDEGDGQWVRAWVNLPSIESGDAGKILRAKSDESGWESITASGAGIATETYVDDKASLLFVSVSDYDSIAGAVAKVKANGGGVLYFPDGSYENDSTHTIDFSDFHVVGQSKNGVAIETTTAMFSLAPEVAGISNISFSNLSITAASKEIIRQSNDNPITNLSVENVTIYHSGTGSAIYFGNSTTEGNENFYFNKVQVWANSSSGYCLAFRKPVKGVWITNCLFSNEHEDSYNNLALYADTNDFHVIGNTFYGGGHSPLACSPAHNGEIIGNYLELKYFTNLTDEGGIEVEWKDTHNGTDTSHHITIQGNVVKGYNWGIFVMQRDEAGANPGIPHDIIISNNIVTECHRGIALIDGTRIIVSNNSVTEGTSSGIYLTGVTEVTINGNHLKTTVPAIRFENAISSDVSILNNRIETDNNALLFQSVTGEVYENITISNNEIKSTVTDQSLIRSSGQTKNLKINGNSFYNGSSTLSIIAGSTNLSFTNNNLYEVGIGLSLASAVTNLEISGNHFNTVTSYAITIDDSSTFVKISNNQFKDITGYPIRLNGAGDHVSVTNNQFHSTATAIRVDSGGKYYSITGNHIYNTSSSGMTFESGDGSYNISNNTVIENAAGHGISIKVDNCLVQGNMIDNTAGSAISDTGTGNTVQNNLEL